MDSNTYSTQRPDGLAALAAAVDGLAAEDPDRLTDAVRAERVLGLRRLLDRLEGHWLKELATVDARGAAGAEQGLQVGSTLGGCAPGCAWAPAPRPASSAPPVPCSVVLWRPRPRPCSAGTSRPRMPGCWPTASRICPITSPWRPNRCWWRRLVGWTRLGCGGSWLTCSLSPTPTAPTARPSGAISGGVVAGPDVGWDGGGGWVVGARGWSQLGGGVGAAGPPRRRPGHA